MAPELSDLVSGAPPAGRLARDNSALRTFTFAEGVLMLVLGVLALIFPILTIDHKQVILPLESPVLLEVSHQLFQLSVSECLVPVLVVSDL